MAGATPRTSVDSYWKNGTIPWMASGEIHKKRVYEVDKFITQEGYDNSSTKLVPKNSVLIALAGQGKTRGTVAINKIELCTNQSIATMIPNINKLDYNYLYYYLESKYDKLRLLSSSDGGRGGLNLKILKNLKIKNIPLETQQYISNFLLILDKKIELLEKKHKNVEKIKEYFIQTKINEINSNSEFIKVKDAFSITRGEVIAKTKVKETPDEVYKYPVYSSQTLNDGIMGYYSDYDFSGDFITWTTDGANAGKTKFRFGEFKCSNVCGVLKAKKEYEYYSNEFIATYLDKNTYKYVSYVGNPKLMNNVMSTIKIPIVDNETTDYYSNVISQFDLKYKLEEIKLNKLKEFKKGLLQKMFV